jgi:hypothetical protein
MPDAPALQRPSILWKSLSAERKLQAADAFWKDGNAGVEQAEVMTAIAQRIKFRPKSVVALPREKKSKHLLALNNVSEMVAARLLVAYHLDQRRPMMASFLDALGVAHEDGLINDENFEAPSAERLQQAAHALSQSYPPEDVALYLTTLVWQDPETWGPLAELPETQPHLEAQPK